MAVPETPSKPPTAWRCPKCGLAAWPAFADGTPLMVEMDRMREPELFPHCTTCAIPPVKVSSGYYLDGGEVKPCRPEEGR